MAEVVTINAPVAQDAGATTVRIALLVLDWEHALFKVHLAEWTNGDFVPGGKRVVAHYQGALALTLMRALNTADLSQASHYHRVMTRLLADGKIPAGTASGTPD